uniref:DUF1073 domain-containing protein n=4 Tax=unclassified bacterial viruses TaxID=12333 RepID=A0AAU6W3V1_9VIRU
MAKPDKKKSKQKMVAKPLPAASKSVTPQRDKAANIAIVRARAAEKPADKIPKFIIQPPALMPGVVPKGETSAVAMDYAPGLYDYAQQYMNSEFQGFPGYPYLASLSTRSEYRSFASTMASELTREWIKVKSTVDQKQSKDNPRIAELEKALEEFNVRGVIQQVAAQECLFGRGQISVNIKGATDSLPLVLSPRTVKQGSLTSFTAIEAMWTSPSAYNALDPTAPDFYRPREWFLLGKQVHASRLLTVITRPLPDMLKPAYNFSGMSLSQLAQPYVENWLRTRQSVSDLINNFSITVLKTNMDQVLQGNDDGADVFARADLFTLMRSNRGLMVMDMEKEDIGQVNTPLSGLHELQAQAQEHLCSVTRIPAMILTGISPSGLNASSEGEVRAFYDWISSQQESFWKPPIKVMIDLLMLHLWGEIDETISFEFNPLWQTSELDKSTIRNTNATADASMIDRGVLSQEEVRERLANDPDSGYAGIDAEDVPEIPEEPDQQGFSGQPDGSDEDDGEGEAKTASDADFDENKHPRSDDGKFGSNGLGKPARLTSSEKSAVSSYTGDDFMRANAELRSGGEPDAQAKRVDSAIEKSYLQSGQTLYRGMTREAAKQLFPSGSINAGDTISDKAFLSTSKSANVAGSIGLGGVVLKIEVGDGQKGLDMQGLSRNEYEKEVLLPRNAKMTVLGTVAPKNPGDPVVVRVAYGSK